MARRRRMMTWRNNLEKKKIKKQKIRPQNPIVNVFHCESKGRLVLLGNVLHLLNSWIAPESAG